MPSFTPALKWPFSGDLSRLIAPWTSWFRAFGSQVGRIGDALAVLPEHLGPKQPLTPDEEKAIHALRVMLVDIDGVKTRHNISTIET